MRGVRPAAVSRATCCVSVRLVAAVKSIFFRARCCTDDDMSSTADQLALDNFRNYLKIPSVHPDPNYEPCVEFLKAQARSLSLPVQVHTKVPDKPVVIITWEGSEPSIPSVLLNSHMDVVPVFEESWRYPPFGAEMDSEGNIYARGSQDMKCVGIQFIESVRRLKEAGVKLRRTIHMSFVPDEEIGGELGMKVFAETPEFKALNVGFALDEGLASPEETYPVFYGERSIWQLHIRCGGPTGHGSLLLPNTAGEKLRVILDKFMDYRAKQKKILESDPNLTIGDVTTVNLTRIFGGVQSNVIPELLTAVFDCRLAVTVDHNKFEEMINGWCKEAGENVKLHFERKSPKVLPSTIDNSNPFWVAFKEAIDKMNMKIRTQIFTGGTDSRYIRIQGIPAIGFSPMNNTKVLLHDHNENLNKDVFLRGIETYKNIIVSVANVQDRTG